MAEQNRQARQVPASNTQSTSSPSKQPAPTQQQSSQFKQGKTVTVGKGVLQTNNNTRTQQATAKNIEEKRQSVKSTASGKLQGAAGQANQQAINQLLSPNQQSIKQGSVQLQSTLRDLKDNYVSIEQKIEQETLKQRIGHQERYATALNKIHQLKKVLKTEVEQRKHAEEHFREMIEEKSQECLNQFTVRYLNKLHAMHETVQTFEKRKATLEEKRQNLKTKIETSMRQSREEIITNVHTKQERFVQEYQKQIDLDVRELKQIGELKHNYEQMTNEIATTRTDEFIQLKQLIVDTIRDNDVYEREENVRKILTKQINTLKDQLKLEMQNRQMADREIYGALQKYQIIIQEQVEKQRSEIKTSKKPLVPPRSPSRTD